MNRSLIAFFTFFVLSISSAAIAQPWFGPEITMSGDTIWHEFPPPDSTYLHDRIIIKFARGALDYDSLCYDCIPSHSGAGGFANMKGKGMRALDQDPDGSFAEYKQTLMAQQFGLRIIIDPAIRSILRANGVSYLMRMTAANPCTDTLSLSRLGD